MNGREFAFWLQGYFEIAGSSSLNATQANQVRTKLAGVTPGEGEVEAQARSFVDFARGMFALVPQQPDAAALSALSGQLQTKLNDLFEHAIDPSIPGDQNAHRRTHRPGGPKRGDVELLC